VFHPERTPPPQIHTGDTAFDGAYRVYTRAADAAARILDARVRRWLMDSAPARTDFELNGDRLLTRTLSGTKAATTVELADKAEELATVLRSVL
jgi:hypothetical protein